MPLADDTMERELVLYAFWYNERRPHQTLEGRTPNEVLPMRSARLTLAAPTCPIPCG